MKNYLHPEEAAAKVAAAIDNGVSEASSNETENAQAGTEQVNNPQSCGHSTSEYSGQEQATVAASAADTTSIEVRRQEIRLALKAHEEVQLADFLEAGFLFGDMPKTMQRGETKKNVTELRKSLERTKRFFRPIELTAARDFIEAGLGSVQRLDGSIVTLDDPDVDLIYVRPDGKQRSCAYAKLFTMKEFKGKEREYDVRVKLCEIPAEELPEYVREIQTASVWDEKTKRQVTVETFTEPSGLTMMDACINESKMSARGAYKLIFLHEGYKKALYDESLVNGKLHPSFHADQSMLERAKRNYMALKVAFRNSPDYFKNSAAVDALIEVRAHEVNDPNGVAESFLEFLQAMQTEDWCEMAMVKTPAEKKTKFLELFNTHKAKMSEDAAYAGVVEERVKAARREYNESFAYAPKKKSKRSKPSNEEIYFGGKKQ